MEATRVTAGELAADLADIMERVSVNREDFSVVEGNVVIAALRPRSKAVHRG